jgi:hypothetical protein
VTNDSAPSYAQANPIGTCVEDVQSPSPILITVKFKSRYACNPTGLPICKFTWGSDMDTGWDVGKQPKPRADELELMRRCESLQNTSPICSHPARLMN